MFEDYIQDAYSFYGTAIENENLGNEREARKFYRAAIFCSASALEAFVNFIGETFKQGDNLEKNEIAYLNDRVLEFSPEKLKVQEKVKYNSIDNKVKFIIKRFNVDFNVSILPQWQDFLKFKALRDSLVHPKIVNDETTLADYKINIKSGLNANIDIMNSISRKLFSKPLRRGLIDLKL